MIRKINNKNLRILSGNTQSSGLPTSLLYLNSVRSGSLSSDSNRIIDPPNVVIFRAAFEKSNTTTGLTCSFYWNTTVDVSGATQLATFRIAQTSRYQQFSRRIYFTNSNTALLMNVNFNQSLDNGDNATTLSTVSVTNWSTTDGYFFFTCAAESGTSDTITNIYLTAEK